MSRFSFRFRNLQCNPSLPLPTTFKRNVPRLILTLIDSRCHDPCDPITARQSPPLLRFVMTHSLPSPHSVRSTALFEDEYRTSCRCSTGIFSPIDCLVSDPRGEIPSSGLRQKGSPSQKGRARVGNYLSIWPSIRPHQTGAARGAIQVRADWTTRRAVRRRRWHRKSHFGVCHQPAPDLGAGPGGPDLGGPDGSPVLRLSPAATGLRPRPGRRGPRRTGAAGPARQGAIVPHRTRRRPPARRPASRFGRRTPGHRAYCGSP